MTDEEKNRAIAEILEPKPVWKDGDWVSSRKLWNMHYGVKTAIDFHDDPQAMVALIEAMQKHGWSFRFWGWQDLMCRAEFARLDLFQKDLKNDKDDESEGLMLAVRDAAAKALGVEDGS